MLTPSLVMVGAPHFFSRTTLRPFGPSVTFTVSARMFIPRSRPRRASSPNAINLAIGVVLNSSCHHVRALLGPTCDDRCTRPPLLGVSSHSVGTHPRRVLTT